MNDRAWDGGPTWEEIVRRVIAEAACRRRYRHGHHPAPMWSIVSRITQYGSTYSVRLCELCGFDSTTGEDMEVKS